MGDVLESPACSKALKSNQSIFPPKTSYLPISKEQYVLLAMLPSGLLWARHPADGAGLLWPPYPEGLLQGLRWDGFHMSCSDPAVLPPPQEAQPPLAPGCTLLLPGTHTNNGFAPLAALLWNFGGQPSSSWTLSVKGRSQGIQQPACSLHFPPKPHPTRVAAWGQTWRGGGADCA